MKLFIFLPHSGSRKRKILINFPMQYYNKNLNVLKETQTQEKILRKYLEFSKTKYPYFTKSSPPEVRCLSRSFKFIIFISPNRYIVKLVFIGMKRTCIVFHLEDKDNFVLYQLDSGLFLFQSQRDHLQNGFSTFLCIPCSFFHLYI